MVQIIFYEILKSKMHVDIEKIVCYNCITTSDTVDTEEETEEEW